MRWKPVYQRAWQASIVDTPLLKHRMHERKLSAAGHASRCDIVRKILRYRGSYIARRPRALWVAFYDFLLEPLPFCLCPFHLSHSSYFWPLGMVTSLRDWTCSNCLRVTLASVRFAWLKSAFLRS